MSTLSSRYPSHTRRGYLLIELVVVVSLLAVFSIIIGGTFTAAYRGQADAVRRDERDHHVDAAMSLLRHDIWNASALRATTTGLTMTTNDAATIDWTWGSSWTRTMHHATETQPSTTTTHFTELPTENITAAIHGPGVTLHFGGTKTPAESISFVSQIMLGGAR